MEVQGVGMLGHIEVSLCFRSVMPMRMKTISCIIQQAHQLKFVADTFKVIMLSVRVPYRV